MGDTNAEKFQGGEEVTLSGLVSDEKSPSFNATPVQCVQMANEPKFTKNNVRSALQYLIRAEEAIDEDGIALDQAQLLINAISRLADHSCSSQLDCESAVLSEYFKLMSKLLQIATDRTSCRRANGRSWVRRVCSIWESKLEESHATVYDYTKLARLVKIDVGDDAWVIRLVEKAASNARDHFHYSYIAEFLMSIGEEVRAVFLYQKAADLCRTESDYYELVYLLRRADVSDQQQRELYAYVYKRLAETSLKMNWIENVRFCIEDTDREKGRLVH